MIYLFATPPRYVYLRGHDDSFDPFVESITSPAVAPGSRFDRPNNYSTPDSEVYFTSGTKIPPLLHTCQESRNFLIKQGYELTFRTPGYKQRTWFNYKKDILIVPVSHSERSRRVGPWSRPINGGLLGAVKYCRLHHLQREDKDRIRRIAQGNSHGWAFPVTTQGFSHQRDRLVPEPLVYETSDFAWWGQLCNSQQDSGRLSPELQLYI